MNKACKEAVAAATELAGYFATHDMEWEARVAETIARHFAGVIRDAEALRKLEKMAQSRACAAISLCALPASSADSSLVSISFHPQGGLDPVVVRDEALAAAIEALAEKVGAK